MECKIIKFMDNVGDWLYIVFLIIAAVSGYSVRKTKRRRVAPIYWGNPTGKLCLMTSLQKGKGFWEILEDMQRKRKNLSPLPDKSR